MACDQLQILSQNRCILHRARQLRSTIALTIARQVDQVWKQGAMLVHHALARQLMHGWTCAMNACDMREAQNACMQRDIVGYSCQWLESSLCQNFPNDCIFDFFTVRAVDFRASAHRENKDESEFFWCHVLQATFCLNSIFHLMVPARGYFFPLFATPSHFRSLPWTVGTPPPRPLCITETLAARTIHCLQRYFLYLCPIGHPILFCRTS